MALTDNYLRQTSLKNNQLTLTFKYNLDEVNYFKIKSKEMVKHVYDIKETSLPRTQKISHYQAKGIKAFRIGQYSKHVIRVVIESRVKMSGEFKIKNRKLILFLPSASNSKKPVAKKSLKKTNAYGYNAKRRRHTIILDAGHGGRDVGASSKRVREKDLTLSMTLKLKTILKKMGYKVLLTRGRDKFMNLKQRTDYAYGKKASLFISIHANAAPKKRTKGVRYEGVEVFYLSLKKSKRVRKKRVLYRGKKVYSKKDYQQMISKRKLLASRKLAHLVHDDILSHVGKHYDINDKGIKRKDFWVLLATKIPSILVETGYLTNEDEVKRLKSQHYQTLLMEGVAQGVNRYYELF
jgi:N-acetylmuramoyl-L-alanine amidase